MADGYSVEARLKATGAEKFARAFENAYNSAGKLQRVGGKMKGVGKMMTAAVTAPVIAMGAAIMHTGAKFDDQMSTVQAVTGATGTDMDKMREQAKKLGRETRFSASESAEGMEMLARAGFETSEVMDALPSVLNLASAGAVDLGDAADITSNILSGFGMEATETSRVADILAQASADSNTNVEGLGQSFKYAAPIAADLGVSIEDTAASIGFLGDAGIQGGQAGRQLRSGLQSLASPTSEAASLMDDLGIEVFDAEGNMKSMPDVIGQLEGGLKGMKSDQRAAALETMFGSDAMSAWSILVNEGSDNLEEFSGVLANSEGAAGDMSDQMEDNLAGAFREMKSALEGLSISFYEMGEGPMRTLVEKFTDLVKWFTNLSDNAKQWIIIAAGVAAAIGPILIVVGTLIGFIPQVIAGFKILGVVIGAITSPVGLVVAAIGLLVAGLVYAYNKSEAFREIVNAAFEKVKEVVMDVIGIVVDFIMDVWGGVVEWWEENNELIKRVANKVWKKVSDIIESVMNFLEPFIEGQWESIKATIKIVWETIKTIVEVAIEFVKGIITTVMKIIDGDWKGAWETIKETLLNIWDIMKDYVKKVAGIIKDNIKNQFNRVKNIIKEKLTGAKDALVQRFKDMLSNAKSKAQSILQSAKDKFNQVKNAIRDKLVQAKDALVSKFVEMVTNTAQKAAEIVTAARDKFTEVKNAIRDKLQEAVVVVSDKITEMPGKVRDKASDMLSAGRDLIVGLIDGIKQKAKDAIDAVTGVVGDAIDGAKNLLKISSPSKVFAEIGAFTTEGFADGIRSMVGDVGKASQEMSLAAMPDVDSMDFNYRTNHLGKNAVGHHNEKINKRNRDISQNITVVSPEPTSPSENARKMKRASRQMAMEWR